jgi:hypothetical protein
VPRSNRKKAVLPERRWRLVPNHEAGNENARSAALNDKCEKRLKHPKFEMERKRNTDDENARKSVSMIKCGKRAKHLT